MGCASSKALALSAEPTEIQGKPTAETSEISAPLTSLWKELVETIDFEETKGGGNDGSAITSRDAGDKDGIVLSFGCFEEDLDSSPLRLDMEDVMGKDPTLGDAGGSQHEGMSLWDFHLCWKTMHHHHVI